MLSAQALQTILAAINTSGIVGVLIVGIWLGLRGDVVTAQQLADCQAQRDTYLHEWIKAISVTQPIGPTNSVPIWRDWPPLPDTPK